MPQKIYFDESGYTGNNLLDAAQQYFSYASIATDDDDARDFVLHLIKKYNIQGGELKGSKLVQFSKGQKVVSEILDRYSGRIKVSISDKKFALACKFFEYIFEPTLSDINSVFYGVGFHLFIANALYMEFESRAAGAEAIFSEFEELMRTGNTSNLESVFSSSEHVNNSPVLIQIREYAQAKTIEIQEELERLSGTSTGKWILDLSGTAIYTQLANWGLKHDAMIAVCDPSKPIREGGGLLNAMVGRKERTVFSEGLGKRHPITFNLAEPVNFLDSKVTHGIQLADVIAAASVYVFSNKDGGSQARWREILSESLDDGSIMPDLDELRLTNQRVQRNAVLLMELHRRATSGESVTEGMPEYVQYIGRALRANPIDFRRSN